MLGEITISHDKRLGNIQLKQPFVNGRLGVQVGRSSYTISDHPHIWWWHVLRPWKKFDKALKKDIYRFDKAFAATIEAW